MPTSITTVLVDKINKLISLSFLKGNDNINHPLLNDDEIIDLQRRVQTIQNSVQQKHEITHKKTGDRRSIYSGLGMDYEESRRYQPGDDPRYMNWQLTARTGQHYIKIFNEERQHSIFIVMDRRHSMRFATKQRLKITQAARTATLVALAALQKNISVGGVILDEKIEWVKESQSKQSVFNFIHQLSRPTSACCAVETQKEPGINDVIRMLNVVLDKGSIIYFISDFFDLNEENQSALFELTSSHQVSAIQIADPAEIKLPEAGALLLKSVESAQPVAINSNSLSDRERYTIASDNHFSSIKSLLEKNAVLHQEILTTVNNIEQEINFVL